MSRERTSSFEVRAVAGRSVSCNNRTIREVAHDSEANPTCVGMQRRSC